MRHMIVSVAVVLTKFTVRWKRVLPRSTKLETSLRPIFSMSGGAKLQLTKRKATISFTVINTGLHDKVDTVSTVIDMAICDFKELHPTEGYKKMAALTLPNYRVEDLEGHAVEAKIEDLGANFEYDLPKTSSVKLVSLDKCA